VIGGPPVRGGGGMPHRIRIISRTPPALRTTGAGNQGIHQASEAGCRRTDSLPGTEQRWRLGLRLSQRRALAAWPVPNGHLVNVGHHISNGVVVSFGSRHIDSCCIRQKVEANPERMHLLHIIAALETLLPRGWESEP
jgi:hypothetical protein